MAEKQSLDKIREAYYGTDIRAEVKDILSGEEFFFDVRLTPTIFNDGKQGITIIIEDITQQKKSERLLRKMVLEILSCIDDAVILLDSCTTAISFVNPATEKMFGLKPGECVGKDLGVQFGIDEMHFVYSGKLQDEFGMRGYYETESRLKRQGSKEFPVTLHLRPIYDDTGQVKKHCHGHQGTTSQKTSSDTSIRSDTGNPQIPLSMRICTDFERYRSVT